MASMPLIKFWPDIEKNVMREFADTVPHEYNEKMIWIWKSLQTRTTNFKIRKSKGAVPHDLGVPNEDPFLQINQFSWQDTNGWKDLNPKFVLMVYRGLCAHRQQGQRLSPLHMACDSGSAHLPP